ncbi:hypothetical protein OHV05_00600 [Kitasatospora sp. NBC_00070]|uniref:InlB B-repeat-containing protein n=1 Tax=Kitasatospora sp. NBC_00070 TaxID=2975962 RepID=UPI0032464A0C
MAGPGLLALAVVALTATTVPSVASPGRQAGVAPTAGRLAGAPDPVLRTADISWDLARARPLLCDPAQDADTSPETTLRLFPDVTVEVTGGQVRPGPTGEVDWAAQVEGDPEGSADFHFDALCSGPDASSAQVAGQISTNGHTYTLTSTTPGKVRVQELHPALSEGTPGRPDDAVDPPDEPKVATPSPAKPSLRADDPSDCQGAKDLNTIDMAVFYTKEAADKAGGEDKVKAQAKLGVDLVNRGFTNSKLAVRARLVHIGPAADEPGLPAENPSETAPYRKWASDNELWTKYAADDIALFQSVGTGTASFVQDPKPTSGKRMFLMMNVAYVSNLTLGHELGHNLGLDHDWVTEPEPGDYPYAHGWIPPSKKWRTIMAYDGGCAGCERINYYSDAEATYEGEPLGAPDTAAQPSDAVRMIRRNAPVVAAMQPEKSPAVYCRLTVKSTPDTGGSATVDVPGPYTRGSLVHATATAKPNHRLVGWSLNGKPLADTDTSVSVPVDADSVLEARYAQIDCALTLQTQPTDGGTVTVDRPAPYRCGSTVTLTATPAPGWTFAGWNRENDPTKRDIVATTPVHEFTLDQDTAMAATFVKSDVIPPTPPTPPTPPVPNPPVPDQQSAPNPPAPPAPPQPVALQSTTPSPKPELASTGTPAPLVGIALTAALTMTVGGIVLARLRRKARG